ncbi:hypothetical protein A1O1_08066 [Capronia coronata CBS 617.96]|uniref:Cytochrome P450 oxidoreductase n=1 Tax=Capronia coronata CBS 617.96 TaxID=1182541 RepID=W9XP67_9EURO|nr:uncharacterized protein A1O1_08066 [Capronia coronata CBS 617.96]EXJ81998.1 hypothetical protein A1O1_08066 [Capronia coronata CBS 617.96]
MNVTFLTTLLGAVSIVRYALGIYFTQTPATFICLAAFLHLFLLLVCLIWLSPRLSPLRKLPLAAQGPWWKTFLLEPLPVDLERFINETPNDGLIRYFGVFHGERLLITKPQGVKEMTLLHAYNFNKVAVAKKLIGHITGRGLVVVDQEEHKRQRKSLNPAFKFKYIKNLFPRFWYHTTQLVNSLEKDLHKDGNLSSFATIDVDRWMMRATLDIIAATGFGVNVNAIQNPDGELARATPLANSTDPRASFFRLLAFLLPQWLYFRMPMARRYEIDRINKALNDAVLPLIKSRRAAVAEKQTLLVSADVEKSPSKIEEFAETDVISTLLRFPQPLSDTELVAQSATLLAAGQDTTSVATTWALYLLARHPQVQSILRAEIHGHLPAPDSDEPVDAALIESLPYLAAVSNETLRLYPPAPIIRREVVKPGTVILGQLLPIGTIVAASVWGTHRAKAVWGADVKDFRPDRFLQYGQDGKMRFDAHGSLHGEEAAYSFIPFGAGVRSCIGERFARGEFATLLAGLIGTFEWALVDQPPDTAEDIKLNFGIVTKPQGGLSLRVRKADGW